MEIIINNHPKKIENVTSLNVQELINMELPEKQKGIAVAVNNAIVPKADWLNHQINNNDNILIIKATQGG